MLNKSVFDYRQLTCYWGDREKATEDNWEWNCLFQCLYSKFFSPQSPLHSTLSCCAAAERFCTKSVGIDTKQIPVLKNSHGCKLLKLLHQAPISNLLSKENGKSNLKQNINVQARRRGGDLTNGSGKTQTFQSLQIPVTSSSSWCCRRSCGEKPQRLHNLDLTMIGMYPKGCLIVPCGMSFTDQLMSA